MHRLWNPFDSLMRLLAILLAVIGIRRGGTTARIVLASIAGWLSSNLIPDIAYFIRTARPRRGPFTYPERRYQPGPRDGERFDKFTERARKVLSLANDEAAHMKHNYIGTEHILLGLVRENEGVAARILADMGMDLPKTRAAVEFIIGRGERPAQEEIDLTPRAKRVIELSFDEARRVNHHYIGTEHILLGLIREGDGIGIGVLESLGVDPKVVRARVLDVINRNSP